MSYEEVATADNLERLRVIALAHPEPSPAVYAHAVRVVLAHARTPADAAALLAVTGLTETARGMAEGR